MTDHRETYTDTTECTLTLERPDTLDGLLELTIDDGRTLDAILHIEPARLLAMIDAIDPDAVRAYLRETPEPVYAIDGTVLVTPEQLDAIPEADGPDDVIERVRGEDEDPTERAQLDRSWALRLAHELFPHAPSLQAVWVAAWIVGGQER